MSGTDVTAAILHARREGRAALVIYLPAGFPDMDISRRCLLAAQEAGADVLEVGLPFSDPMMDGPSIQMANQVALDQGYSVADDLAMCGVLSGDLRIPALAMTYITIPDTWGYTRFADTASDAGLSGVILPDLPIAEADGWLTQARRRDLATVFLASSVSTDERLDQIAATSTGFVYATGLLGVTGVKSVAQDATRELVERLRVRTQTPIAVGIGVRTRDDAATVGSYADGVIVGSAVVDAVAAGDASSAPDRVAELVSELRAGVDAARG